MPGPMTVARTGSEGRWAFGAAPVGLDYRRGSAFEDVLGAVFSAFCIGQMTPRV